jgi:hypothetical protein
MTALLSAEVKRTLSATAGLFGTTGEFFFSAATNPHQGRCQQSTDVL